MERIPGRRQIILPLIALLFAGSTLSPTLSWGCTKPDYRYVANKLKKLKVRKSFIKTLLKEADSDICEDVIRLNVLSFRKTADYSGHLSSSAKEKSQVFIDQHKSTFAKAQLKYQIPREIIASLIWVETKLGTQTGDMSVPNVYLNLAMADHPKIVKSSLKAMKAEIPANDPNRVADLKKVKERSKTKAKWAIEQLVALEKMQRNRKVKVFELEGSFAGAFGLPQFIPSSYLKWAEDGNGDKIIDLYNGDDAIFSVARYLKEHGWDIEPASIKQALFEYNRSQAYGETIITLAKQLSQNTESM